VEWFEGERKTESGKDWAWIKTCWGEVSLTKTRGRTVKGWGEETAWTTERRRSSTGKRKIW